MYKLKFIDSYRFMQNSLSSLVDNLSEFDKKIPQETLIKNFSNTYQLCNNSNFNLLLRK